MKKISFLFIITFLIQIPFFLFELEKILPGDYPYSIKLGYKEAVSFMNSSHITIFKTDKLKRIIYGEAPYENYTLDDLTKGFHQLANLCSMNWGGFIVTGGVMFFGKEPQEKVEKMKDRLKQHAQELLDKIKGK